MRFTATCALAILIAAAAAASSIMLTEEDVEFMDRVAKLRPRTVLYGHLCHYGEFLFVKNGLEDSFQDVLVVRGEDGSAQVFLQEIPKLVHLADIDRTGKITYIESPAPGTERAAKVARPTQWPMQDKDVPNFRKLFSSAQSPPYVVIGRSVPNLSRPKTCIGIMYRLHDNRLYNKNLYCPLQPGKPTYTPSMCFVIRESATKLTVNDSHSPGRPLCTITRPDPSAPSVVNWPSSRRVVWPYMTDDNCPVLPNRPRFLSPEVNPIEIVYTYTDSEGKRKEKYIPIAR